MVCDLSFRAVGQTQWVIIDHHATDLAPRRLNSSTIPASPPDCSAMSCAAITNGSPELDRLVRLNNVVFP